MPSIKDQSTVEAVAREFTSNGRNKENALKSVGYSKNYAEHRADCVLSNVGVKQAIARIDAKSEQKLEFDRDIAIKEHNADLLRLQPKAESGDVLAIRARTAILHELASISSLHGQQPIKIETDVKHSTAANEQALLRKRMGLLERMGQQASGIERN